MKIETGSYKKRKIEDYTKEGSMVQITYDIPSLKDDSAIIVKQEYSNGKITYQYLYDDEEVGIYKTLKEAIERAYDDYGDGVDFTEDDLRRLCTKRSDIYILHVNRMRNIRIELQVDSHSQLATMIVDVNDDTIKTYTFENINEAVAFSNGFLWVATDEHCQIR